MVLIWAVLGGLVVIAVLSSVYLHFTDGPYEPYSSSEEEMPGEHHKNTKY